MADFYEVHANVCLYFIFRKFFWDIKFTPMGRRKLGNRNGWSMLYKYFSFIDIFLRKKQAKAAQTGSTTRGDGGYLLVFFTVVAFLFVANHLLGQMPAHPEPVQLKYFVEPVGRELKVQDAAEELRSGKFKVPTDKSETLNLGYMREGVWVLMTFKNTRADSTRRFVLQLRHTYINGSFTPVRLQGDSERPSGYRLGETTSFTDTLLPRTQGMNDIRHVSFPIDLEQGQEFHALVRLRAHVMSVPFVILEERSFLSSIVREMVTTASFFGGLMLLAFYNFMVGMARREQEFLYYGAYVASISLMIVAINGSGHMFIWPDMLWLHYNSANLLINVCIMSYMAFTMTLFKNAPLEGWERKVWIGLFACGCLGIVLQIVEGAFLASIQANLVTLAGLLACLFRAWRARKVYGRIANLFLISEGILFAGAFVYCIKMFGWLSSSPLTLNVVTLAAALEGILLSFVLSEKMRQTMHERELALNRLAEAQQHLEASVRDRTLALAARYTSHEVLNPVFAVRLKAERIRDELLLSQEREKQTRTAAEQNILQKVNEIFQLIDSIIHTIRAIRTLSSDGLREEVVEVNIELAFEDAMRMLELKAQQVKCKVHTDFLRHQCVRARRSDVVQVIMNLVSNSMDAVAGQEHRWIRVSSRWVARDRNNAEAALEISVIDSGPGPRREIRDKLFDSEVSTKDAEQGMGLGLAFCQKLVRRNGGVIGFDANSRQTRFYFFLPAAVKSVTEPTPELSRAS